MDGHGTSAAQQRARRVTRWLITLATGCGSQSPQEHFDELSAQVTVDCGTLVTCSSTSLEANQVCLQQALDRGVVARLSQKRRELHGGYDFEFLITEDHVIWNFSSAEDGPDSLWSESLCSGPVIILGGGSASECPVVRATNCR